MRPVKVLIVDDSMTMRRLIRLALSDDPRIQVVGEARDTAQATARIAELRPDVLTLDVEMPGESGLAFLERLMVDRPMPVVMISTLTQSGSAAAVQALSLGAVDCVGKPSAPQWGDFAGLRDLIVAAARARIRARPRPVPAPPSEPPRDRGFAWNGRVVLIGSSTGGVDALERILAEFPPNCPPTLITQHMPPAFLANFAQRLDARIAPRVRLAETGLPVQQGSIYIAPGGETHLRLGQPRAPVCELVEDDKRNGHRPSVDFLFESGAALGERAIGVMLTGMGRDGAEAMLALRRAGATCLAQDEATSVVWGMPRVAHELGAVDRLVPLQDMAETILGLSGRRVPG